MLNLGRADEREIGKIDVLPLHSGDTITLMIPGGGGYGDPFERDPLATLQDVRRGVVSLQSARQDYGVVISDGEVDAAATAAERAGTGRSQGGAPTFDPERLAWESVCDDQTMGALVGKLDKFPAVRRWEMRKKLFEHAFPGLCTPGAKPSAFLADASEAGAARTRLLAAIAAL